MTRSKRKPTAAERKAQEAANSVARKERQAEVLREMGPALLDDFDAGVECMAVGARPLITHWLQRLQWVCIGLLSIATLATSIQVLRFDPDVRGFAIGPSGEVFEIKMSTLDASRQAVAQPLSKAGAK